MFSVNFAKFVRTRFIKKIAGTLEILTKYYNDLQRLTKSNIKNYVEIEIKIFF